tara:strand:- start:155 stop:910 length:756 start_codon:yes stop_codon:yes gene_type:complete
MKKIKQKENPILSLCCNILIPVIILKNGNQWINKILIKYHGEDWFYANSIIVDISSIVFFIALICPVIYFFYDLINRKNINLISILGFINILLTGGIGIFGAKYGLSKNWFIFKEGMLPIIIGLVLIIMSKYRQNSFNNILLNEVLFDNDKIRISIKEDMQYEFEYIIKKAGYYLIGGFFISSIIQFTLAYLIVVSSPGEPSFNKEVSTMTWVSYIAVLLPTMLIVGKGYLGLISGIEKVTSLKKEEFLKS